MQTFLATTSRPNLFVSRKPHALTQTEGNPTHNSDIHPNCHSRFNIQHILHDLSLPWTSLVEPTVLMMVVVTSLTAAAMFGLFEQKNLFFFIPLFILWIPVSFSSRGSSVLMMMVMTTVPTILATIPITLLPPPSHHPDDSSPHLYRHVAAQRRTFCSTLIKTL